MAVGNALPSCVDQNSLCLRRWCPGSILDTLNGNAPYQGQLNFVGREHSCHQELQWHVHHFPELQRHDTCLSFITFTNSARLLKFRTTAFENRQHMQHHSFFPGFLPGEAQFMRAKICKGSSVNIVANRIPVRPPTAETCVSAVLSATDMLVQPELDHGNVVLPCCLLGRLSPLAGLCHWACICQPNLTAWHSANLLGRPTDEVQGC